MKVTTFCKVAVSAGAAALLVGALATPAQADPTSGFGTLVGFGSDTTQDVVNGLATAIGGGKIASYDAVGGSSSVVVRAGGSAVPRTSGSGAGRDALLVAIGRIPEKSGVALSDGTTKTIDSSIIGNIDFARSSGGPAAADTTADGSVAYVPFARDAVGVAFAPSSPLASVPLFVGSSADALTAPSLYRIYRGDVKFVYFNGATYFGAGATSTVPAGATVAYELRPLLPKFGSGTRSYFMGQVGLTDASGYTTTNTFIKDVSGGTAIQEHDGTAIIAESTSTTLALAPFSIGQWVAQANAVPGVTDRRHAVVLGSLSKAATGQVAATTGAGPYATNPAFNAMVRDVYNIVPSRLADDPTTDIAKTFIGSNSLVCQQSSVITTYGFLQMPGGSAAATCGYSQLRAYSPSASTTTLAVSGTSLVGQNISATATVVSNGNGGGQVRFMSGATVLATQTIAKGSSTAAATFTAKSVGSLPVKAIFVPALAGVASSSSADVAIAVAGTTSAVAFATPKLVTGKKATVTVNVAGGDATGGTVTLKDGAAVLGTVAVNPGATSVAVSFTPTKLKYSLSATYVPKTTTVIGSSTAAVAVKATKGKAVITVKKIKTVKAGKTSKVTVTIVGGTGKFSIKEGKKVLVKSATLKKGTATVSIKKLKKGKHKLTIVYKGSSVYKATTKTGTVLKIS